MKSPKKGNSHDQLKITIDSGSSDEYGEEKTLSPILKNSRKPSISPKDISAIPNLTPIMHSEKIHEKSRNNLWEAFITPREPKEKSKSRDPSISPRDREKKDKDIKSQDAKYENLFLFFLSSFIFPRRSSSSCSNQNKKDGNKKAKIGITIMKSPNSDRTFESRLLDQEIDNMSIKNKLLDNG